MRQYFILHYDNMLNYYILKSGAFIITNSFAAFILLARKVDPPIIITIFYT